MIFSRGSRTAGRHAARDRPERSRAQADQQPAGRTLAEELGLAGVAGGGGQPVREPEQPAATHRPPPEPVGPFDAAEAPAGVARLDLGSLQIPSVPGVQVRVQAHPDGSLARVVLVHGASALQLAAFAAPRSEPIWDEVREEIRKSLFTEGVAAEAVDGRYGVELRARVRTQEGLKDLRFMGVSGPRWLVRADFQGPAAVDPEASPELAACLRGLVVDRGEEARPAREALPLRLSARMAAQVHQQVAAGAPATVAGAGRAGPGPAGVPAAGAEVAGAAAGEPPRRRKPSPRPRPYRTDGAHGAEPTAGRT